MTLKNSFLAFAFVGIMAGGAALAPHSASAQACTFGRVLAVGSAGSDVYCLQNWLASQGYFYAGVTGYYGPVTQQAVMQWQAAHGIPATGVFSPSYAGSSVPTYYSGYQAAPLGYSTSYGDTSSDALNAMQDAMNTLSDAYDEFDSRGDRGNALNYLNDAHSDLYDALRDFVAGNYRNAVDEAQSAEDNANNALDELGGGNNHHHNNNNSDRSDARDAIDQTQNDLDDAWHEVDRSNASSSRINRAENDLGDAQNSLDDAQNSYDDGYYQDAIDFTDDAENSISDALDEL